MTFIVTEFGRSSGQKKLMGILTSGFGTGRVRLGVALVVLKVLLSH